MNIRISREANSDIEQIWLYTLKKWSKEQADRYYNIIFDEIDYLASYPNSGKDLSRVRKGYFRTRVKSHFIFFKLTQNKMKS